VANSPEQNGFQQLSKIIESQMRVTQVSRHVIPGSWARSPEGWPGWAGTRNLQFLFSSRHYCHYYCHSNSLHLLRSTASSSL